MQRDPEPGRPAPSAPPRWSSSAPSSARCAPSPLDGVEPTLENLESGRYPLEKPIHVAFRSPAPEGVRRFVAFLASPAARARTPPRAGRPFPRLPVARLTRAQRIPRVVTAPGRRPLAGRGRAAPVRLPPLLLSVPGGKRPGRGRVRALAVDHVVAANPEMWRYEECPARGGGLRAPRGWLERPATHRGPGRRDRCRGGRRRPRPALVRSWPVHDAGVRVGRVEVTQSLRPLASRALLLALVLAPLAFLAFVGCSGPSRPAPSGSARTPCAPPRPGSGRSPSTPPT